MTYDLIIIGAGNVGTFHAYHALNLGKKVLLLEKDSEPMEATVRNFGQIVPSGQAFDTWFDFGRKSLDIYKKIQSKHNITLRNNGSYYFASDESEMMLLEEINQIFQEKNYDCELLTSISCLKNIPDLKADYVQGGIFLPQECSVEPRTMVHRVREMLVKYDGLHYQNNTSVLQCDIKEGLCEVVTAKHEVFRSEKVAVCSGREFKILFANLFAQSGMKVSKLNMMSTYPQTSVQLKGNILSGLTIRRYDSFKSCPSYAQIAKPEWLKPFNEWGIHILFKQALDGSIIIGDSHEYAGVDESAALDFGINMEINALILQEARRILDLPNWQIQNYWAGYYAQTDDGGVYEHQIADKIFIATGIGGKGMTTAAGYSEKRIGEVFE